MRIQQRGITDGWLILIVLAVVVAAGWVAYERIDGRGYARGKSETEAGYAKRDNDALVKANQRIQELQDAARAKEREHAAQLTAINDQYQRDKAREIANRDRVIAGLRDGTTRLYVQLAGEAADRCRGGMPETAAGGGGNTGTGRTGILGEADSAFLINEANRADRIAGKLKACQAIVRSDRK